MQKRAAALMRAGWSRSRQADGAAHRVAGVGERPPGLAALAQHAVDEREHARGQAGHVEKAVGDGLVDAVAGEVPADDVEVVRQQLGDLGPERGRGRAEGRPAHQEGQVGGAAELDADDRGSGHGRPPCRARATSSSMIASVLPR